MPDRHDPSDSEPLSFSTDFNDCFDQAALDDSSHILSDGLVSADGSSGLNNSKIMGWLFDSPAETKADPAAAQDHGAKDRQAQLQAIAKSSYSCVRATNRRTADNGNKKKPDAAPPLTSKRQSKPKPRRNAILEKNVIDFEPMPYNFETYQRQARGPKKKKKKKKRRATIGPLAPSQVMLAKDHLMSEAMRKLRESMQRSDLSRRQVAMQRALLAAPQQQQQCAMGYKNYHPSFSSGDSFDMIYHHYQQHCHTSDTFDMAPTEPVPAKRLPSPSMMTALPTNFWEMFTGAAVRRTSS